MSSIRLNYNKNEENNYQFYRFLSLVLHPNGDAEQEKHTYLTR